MRQPNEDFFEFSLTILLHQSMPWMYRCGAVKDDWKSAGSDMTGWNAVTLGHTPSHTCSTTHYLRTEFDIPTASFAAYEIGAYAQEGFAMYVNGIEAMRHNLPQGNITDTTQALIQDDQPLWRRGIRNGADIQSKTRAVVAVEYHRIPNSPLYQVIFNAFILALHGSNPSNCYMISHPMTMYTVPNGYVGSFDDSEPSWLHGDDDDGSTRWHGIEESMDFDEETFFDLGDSTNGTIRILPQHNYEFQVNGMEMFNGVGHDGPANDLNNFWFFGMEVYKGKIWRNITLADKKNWGLRRLEYQTIFFPYVTQLFSDFRLLMRGGMDSYPPLIHEMHLLVCNIPPPTTLLFPKTKYSVTRGAELLDVSPTWLGVHDCTCDRVLPMNTVLDPVACTIRGFPRHKYSSSYVITAHSPVVMSTAITIEVDDCVGLGLVISRKYGAHPQFETFLIRSLSSGGVIYEERPYTNQMAGQTKELRFCLEYSRDYRLEMGHLDWKDNSNIRLGYVLEENDVEWFYLGKSSSYKRVSRQYQFYTNREVNPDSTWFCMFGIVPEAWTTNDMTGWKTGSRDHWPTLQNNIQLYKFKFSTEKYESTYGFSISVRFTHGCIVFINGIELFRSNLPDGPITNNTLATKYFSKVMFHMNTFPALESRVDPTVSQMTHLKPPYLIEKDNILAIGLFSNKTKIEEGEKSVFDASLRVFIGSCSSRTFDFTANDINLSEGSARNLFNKEPGFVGLSTQYYSGAEIVFNDDRREWISSVTLTGGRMFDEIPNQFCIEARQNNETVWSKLRCVKSFQFSQFSQRRKIWLGNNKSYQRYRFVAVNQTKAMKLYDIELFADLMERSIHDFKYPTPMSFYPHRYENFEMADVSPLTNDYAECFVDESTPLPELFDFDLSSCTLIQRHENKTSINFDDFDDEVSSSRSQLLKTKKNKNVEKEEERMPFIESQSMGEMPIDQTITVYARPFNALDMWFETNLRILKEQCDKTLVTIQINVDSDPGDVAYTLYKGTDRLTAQVIKKRDHVQFSQQYWFEDLCLDHSDYLLEVKSPSKTGWLFPFHVTVSIDEKRFILATEHVDEGYVESLLYFSAIVPFQRMRSVWWTYVGKDDSLPSNWESNDFTPEEPDWILQNWLDYWTWLLKKENRKRQSVAARLSFHAKYEVNQLTLMNVGIISSWGYYMSLNQNVIANTTRESQAYPENEWVQVEWSKEKFRLYGNVVALKALKPKGERWDKDDWLDATAVIYSSQLPLFQSMSLQCMYVAYAYVFAKATTSELVDHGQTPHLMFDHFSQSFASLLMTPDAFVVFDITNSNNTHVNAYSLMSAESIESINFLLFGWNGENRDFAVLLDNQTHVSLLGRRRTIFGASPLLLKYEHLELRFVRNHNEVTSVAISEINFFYCNTISIGSCAALGDYQAVPNGHLSPGPCRDSAMYYGYSYRVCSDGMFGEVKYDRCYLYPPKNLFYPKPEYTFVSGRMGKTDRANVTNSVAFYQLISNTPLPKDLVFSRETGQISGGLVESVKNGTVIMYHVAAVNADDKSTGTSISLRLEVGYCGTQAGIAKEHAFGETVTIQCTDIGRHAGTMRMKCVYGESAPKWEVESDDCIGAGVVAIVVCLAVALIILIIVKSISAIRDKKKVQVLKAGNSYEMPLL